jgi:hypothetical protein
MGPTQWPSIFTHPRSFEESDELERKTYLELIMEVREDDGKDYAEDDKDDNEDDDEDDKDDDKNDDEGHDLVRSFTAFEQHIPVRRRTSNFSSRRTEHLVEGLVNGRQVDAFPDTGADSSFISLKPADELGLTPSHRNERAIHLPNKKVVVSPGVVEVPWVFRGESSLSKIQCWIFPESVHELVLGNPFIKLSETLTRFRHRIKSRLAAFSRRLRLRLMGFEQQRVWSLLSGHLTMVLPDTGSDVMLVSSKYAEETGLEVDGHPDNWLEVQYVDGSTDWTSGVARNVSWSVGNTTVSCDFHVLDSLDVDVVLSNDYLFGMDIFSEHQEELLSLDSEEDMVRFFGIRLVHSPKQDIDQSEAGKLLQQTYIPGPTNS